MKRREFIAALAASPAAPLAETAQERSPAAPATSAKPVTITLLGTGTPAPSLTRQSSGYLIEVGDDLIVWDHGPGAHQRLIESGHRSTETTHAFFTHLHYDHCMDYGRLVLQRWDQGADRISDLNVYGPPPLARMTRAALRRRRCLWSRHPRARRAPKQPRRVRSARRETATPAAGASGHGDSRRVGHRRQWMESDGRVRAARPAVSRMPRPSARYQGRLDLLHRRQRLQRQHRGTGQGL